jgi:hypothetical protein
VDRIFSLSAAAAAHDHVDAGRGPGKVVLNL